MAQDSCLSTGMTALQILGFDVAWGHLTLPGLYAVQVCCQQLWLQMMQSSNILISGPDGVPAAASFWCTSLT